MKSCRSEEPQHIGGDWLEPTILGQATKARNVPVFRCRWPDDLLANAATSGELHRGSSQIRTSLDDWFRTGNKPPAQLGNGFSGSAERRECGNIRQQMLLRMVY